MFFRFSDELSELSDNAHCDASLNKKIGRNNSTLIRRARIKRRSIDEAPHRRIIIFHIGQIKWILANQDFHTFPKKGFESS